MSSLVDGRSTWKERFSFDFLKREIFKTTYGTRSSPLARLDPRTVFGWYLFFALAPWFSFDPVVLVGYILITGMVAALSRVSGLMVFFLGFGVITQLLGLAVATLAFGGDVRVFQHLGILVLKLVAVSLASIAAFTGLDPERLGDGLATLGLPNPLVFGISYAYRIVPVLIDEYHSIFNACRMRTPAPRGGTLALPAKALHFLRLLMKCFHPMMLNTAKRTRATAEALELRGFGYSQAHAEVARVRLASLRLTTGDALFFSANLGGLGLLWAVARFLA